MTVKLKHGVELQIGPLRTRDTPSQARAVERVRVILQAAARLLCTSEPQDLNTTLIAEEAGIPVSSIYRYFPSLDDLLRELYLQTSSEIREKLFLALNDSTRFPTWRSRLEASLEIMREYIATHPYYRPLLVTFLAGRGAVTTGDDEHDELVDFLATRWAKQLDGFVGGDPYVVASTVVQIAVSMEDLIAAQTDNAKAAAYFKEMNTALSSYLTHYLND